MGQHQARTGPIQNDAAAITVDMLQGCLPSEKSHQRVSRSAVFSTPDVAAFANESVIGWHPDTPRLPKPTRGPSFFPFSGTEAPSSPEMFAGCLPDRPNRQPRRFPSVFTVPDIDPFTIESTFASRPERARLLLGPRIGQPLGQPTHTDAPFSAEMTAGSIPTVKRYTAPRHDGWQWLTPEIAIFSIEMVIGSHPDTSRVLLASRLGLPVGETADIVTPPPPPPVDTGATPGWPGPSDTPGYERGKSIGWLTREYRRQPGQRPTKRAKMVPVVAPEQRPDVTPQPRGLPVLVRVEGVGGIGGVGQVHACIGMAVASSSARGMVVQAFSVKPARKALTAEEWAAVNLALSDD